MARPGALALFVSLLSVVLLAWPGAADRDAGKGSEEAADARCDAAGEESKPVNRHSVADPEVPSSAVETGDLRAGSPSPPISSRDQQMMETYGAIKPKKKVKVVRKRRAKKKSGKSAAEDTSVAQELVPILQPSLQEPAKEIVEIVDQQQQAVEMNVGEEEEKEEMLAPEDLIDIDPCCGEGAAEEALSGGTYTVTVNHSGLSLSTSGQSGDCSPAQTSMPAVSVTYLCPQQCFVNLLGYQDFVKLLEQHPGATETDVEDCAKNDCNGQCYNTHSSSWHRNSVVAAAAPRLRGCTVIGGGDGRVVMTSS